MDESKLLPLPPHLIEAITIIHEKRQEAIAKADIDALLKQDYIAVRQPGWALSSKGRDLMKRISPPKRKRPVTDYEVK